MSCTSGSRTSKYVDICKWQKNRHNGARLQQNVADITEHMAELHCVGGMQNAKLCSLNDLCWP